MAPNLRSPCEEFAFLCAMMRRYAVVEELSALGAPCTPALGRSGAPSAEMKEWEAKGFRVTGSVCDVSVREQRERLIRDVADRFAGKLNILVNNAGITIDKPTLEYTAEEYSITMATNLESAFNLCQLSHPLLKASGSGSIVFISSVCGVIAEASSSIYSMTKDEHDDDRECRSIIIFPSSLLANHLAIIIALLQVP
ncbi:hypothetical protein ACQ4PT_063213 [Festuca glaucescens]